MIKLFLTSDNHFGRNFDKYPKEVKETIIEKRYKAFDDMVKKANAEKCNFFVVAGDLFEGINAPVSDIKKVIECLKKFDGEVLVLPGNHDYYTGEEKIWETFKKNTESIDNITILNEFREYEFENISFFPAYCDSKHSDENKLGEYEDYEFDEDRFNVLIAHGAIEGLTPDNEGEYFLMSEHELENVGVDCCLIGHTHIPYPANLEEGKDIDGYTIFNAGTHSQLDLHNNTDGECFIISLENNNGKKKVKARKYVSGTIRLYDIDVNVKNESLKDAITRALPKEANSKENETIIRISLKGSVSTNDYVDREKIYEEILSKYLFYERDESELAEEISIEKIRKEFAETSFVAKLLESLTDEPIEQRMAYDLIKECK